MGSDHSQTLSSAEAKKYAQGSHFDEKEIQHLWKQFRYIASMRLVDGVVDLTEFQNVLGIQNKDFAQCIFNAFDKNSSSKIEFPEFVNFLSCLSPKANVTEKSNFIFKIFDKDRSGSITKEEFKEILTFSFAEGQTIHHTQSEIDSMAESIFAKIDPDKSGTITLNEFVKEANRNPSILNCVFFDYKALMGE